MRNMQKKINLRKKPASGRTTKKSLNPKPYIDLIENPVLKEIVKSMLYDPYPRERAHAACRIGWLTKEEAGLAIPALKHALFDWDRIVRFEASASLAKFIGLRKVIGLIEELYPKDALSEMPAEFFITEQTGIFREVERDGLRKIGHPTPSELAKIEGKTPDRLHRGLPVYFELIPASGLYGGSKNAGGRFDRGFIRVELDKTKLPKQFRGLAMEHEYGEIFSHSVGIGFEMLWLEKKGLFPKYLKWLRDNYPSRKQEYIEIIKKDPKGFAEFIKYFPELRKRQR